jgi:Ca-activated chloride channel family protein
MTFLWPDMLWLLLSAPVLIGTYFFLLRKRRKLAMPFPYLALIKQGLDRRAAIRRHIPPALLLMAISLLIGALARPSAVVVLPSRGGTIIMAMDVSASMKSTDVSPNRIIAAQVAAKTLIRDRAQQTRIGIVKFSNSAYLVQSPTVDSVALNAAIDNLSPQFTTAIGDAVYAALQMIFPDIDVDALIPGHDGSEFVAVGDSATRPNAPPRPKPVLSFVQPGSYHSAAVILMTDGRNTAGPDPVEAARLAANLGVRIFTIGFGTPVRQIRNLEGTDTYTILDEVTLRQMADMTKGLYFHAQSSDELAKIYKQLTTSIEKRPEETEVTVVFVAAATALCALSVLLSMLWYHRIF